ncbi:4'-phosphopantetheinyl transferase superfamily protein [Inhella proteolytica]|uniref:4'-phosphopantetheinyl transferase superfamily protein n=1 Tax=Inhella proteolytica TaxID=2795029 RepID=A0A931J4Z8_9BURK|nr:4'-phosphopantetheinyl transferase superfamily protein [Inhella proteolytica]MBH9576427.1 4'-phosphopantetheinyl transferase superfamily protein [Inhella proteolytica]
MSNDFLTNLLARMTRRSSISEEATLASLGLSRSFGLGALRAQLEAQLGRRLPVLQPNLSVAALRALLATEGAAPAAAAAPAEEPSAPTPSGGALPLGLGMDVQSLDSLPETDDLRAHPVYAGLFTAAEIAGALLKPEPRRHLCGLFCAKEAAKKAHPLLLNLHPLELEIRHDPAGRPLLRLGDASPAAARALRSLVAITHGKDFSAATVVVFG